MAVPWSLRNLTQAYPPILGSISADPLVDLDGCAILESAETHLRAHDAGLLQGFRRTLALAAGGSTSGALRR
jgi:hypothetical protein